MPTRRALEDGAGPRVHPWLDALLLITGLAIYGHTLAPTVLPADSGEFQFVSYVLGIAHPPGYPLYTVLAKLFTFVPWGDVACRVNVFSALTSALTLVVLSIVVRRITGSTLAGWIAAAALAFAATFWAQATTANIRSLTALFVALHLYTLLAYGETRQERHLLAFAVALGLGITHHSSLVPLLVPYLAFLFWTDPALLRTPRAWFKPGLAFLASLSVLLYLPLRSALGAPFDPAPIRTVSGFLEHVLALGFRGDMFYFVQPTALWARLKVLGNILLFEFGLTWLLLAAVGASSLLLRRPRALLLCLGVLGVNATLAVTYRAPQTVEYLMPAYVALVCLSAYGVWYLAEPLRLSRLSLLPWGVAAILASALFVRNYPSFHQLSQDRSARHYAESVLRAAPPGARILSNWHYATPLWYMQYVEGLRSDVSVDYVYPEGAEPIAQTWLRRVQGSVVERPTMVTNLYPEFQATSYTFQPLAGAFLVQSGPSFEVSTTATPLETLFDERIAFVGYECTPGHLSPSDSLTVRLYWRPTVKLERDYSFFIHLVDASGVPLGQGDTTHPAARYAVGQVIMDEYRIPLLPTVKPGRYRLLAGVYITLPEGGWRRLTTRGGQDHVVLTEVEVRPLTIAPVTLHRLGRRFGCGYTVLSADYDRSVPGQLRLYLHWRADHAVTAEWQAVIFGGETAIATATLPAVPERTYFTTAHDLPAGVTAQALELHSAGVRSAYLGPLRIPLGYRVGLPVPSADARYVPLGGEMILVKAEHPPTVHPGETMRVRLTFVGSRPVTKDYTISLNLTGQRGVLLAQHDGTPALGAIPTLKWIRGITVYDEHELAIPPNAAGSATLQLTVYDAFTIKPLPVLDERLARLGQGTKIALGTVAILPSTTEP